MTVSKLQAQVEGIFLNHMIFIWTFWPTKCMEDKA